MCMMNFFDWIRRKYFEWSNGGQRSENEYALWLGVSQPTVNSWMRKTRGQPRSKEVIAALHSKYGDEVYDVLGLPRAPSLFDDMPDGFELLVLALQKAWTAELESKGITTNSPEAREIFKKHLRRLSDSFPNIEMDI